MRPTYLEVTIQTRSVTHEYTQQNKIYKYSRGKQGNIKTTLYASEQSLEFSSANSGNPVMFRQNTAVSGTLDTLNHADQSNPYLIYS